MGGDYCVCVHTKLDWVVTMVFVFNRNWVVTIVFVFRLNGNRVQLSCARHMRACVRLAWQGFGKTRFHTSKLVLLSREGIKRNLVFLGLSPQSLLLVGGVTPMRKFHKKCFGI